MKNIDFGKTVSLFANIGVVAGIVLLAIELQQNNELLRAQQRFNRLSIATGSTTLLAENPELAEAVAKVNVATTGLDDIELTLGERTQVRNYWTRVINNQQWTYQEIGRDELPIESWRDLANSNGWRYVWNSVNHRFNPEFVQWMDENVIDQ